MNKLKHIGIATIVTLLCFSCEYLNNLTGSGTLIQKNMNTGEVKYIIANAPCRILLQNTDNNEITIEGYDNLIENLNIDYRNDSLIIDHSKSDFLQKSKLIEIHLSSKNLKRFTANKAIELMAPETLHKDNFVMIMNGGAKYAEIELDVNCNQLTLAVYGNNNIGNYYLSGTSGSTKFTLEGSVNINALDLLSEKITVQHKSIGHCKISADKTINIKSYSSGDLYYKGDAIVTHERISVPFLQSTGTVIKLD